MEPEYMRLGYASYRAMRFWRWCEKKRGRVNRIGPLNKRQRRQRRAFMVYWRKRNDKLTQAGGAQCR